MTQFRESIVLSDSHGFHDTMLEMFTAEGLTTPEGEWIAPEDVQLIHLGDTVDRGPDSPGVFNFFRDLQRDLGPERVVRLMGNHEYAYCGGPTFYGADEPDVAELAGAMREDAAAGLLKFAHPLTARGKEWLCLHGGLDPRWPGLEMSPYLLAEYINQIGRDFFTRDIQGWRYTRPRRTDEEVEEFLALEQERALVAGISRVRGGYDRLSGVTWCDIKAELMPQEDHLKVNQIVGHRSSDEIFFSEKGKLIGVNVHYGLAQLLRIDLKTGAMVTSAIHGEEWGQAWGT